MNKFSISVVDDEKTIRDGISIVLEGEYRLSTYPNAEKALAAMQENQPDLVLLDVGLPGMSGIDALKAIKMEYPEVVVIMITAYEDVDTVISAMKAGAHDYVVKPLHMDGLEVTIGNALDTIRLKKEVQVLQGKYLKEHIPCFIGESKAIQDVMEFIKTVAKSPDTPVLIQGETGTGKELIAAAIHYNSPNWKSTFATLNCAAIPKELIESELFGYKKGAFSGADPAGKKGLVASAADGTLFLDEVGDLSQEAQAKLLRFLELGEYYPLGSSRKKQIKTRLVSATNKNLAEMMETGQFRKDLYFRLGVIKVKVPSLNQRPDDIMPLAKYFLKEFSDKLGKGMTGLSSEAQAALMKHTWTGNVRELKNVMEAAVVVSNSAELVLEDLDVSFRVAVSGFETSTAHADATDFPSDGFCLVSMLEHMEKKYIQKAMQLAKNNESQAARLLGMNHHTFRYRRKKLFSS